jgi:hypothetical protein
MRKEIFGSGSKALMFVPNLWGFSTRFRDRQKPIGFYPRFQTTTVSSSFYKKGTADKKGDKF